MKLVAGFGLFCHVSLRPHSLGLLSVGPVTTGRAAGRSATHRSDLKARCRVAEWCVRGLPGTRVIFSRVGMRSRKWQHYVSVRGLLMTALIVVTAVVVGVTIWYPRSAPTDAPDEKYPPAATSAPAETPAPEVAPAAPSTTVAPPAPPPTPVVEEPTTTAPQTYTPTYVPPPVVSETPTTTASSAAATPPPSAAPSPPSRPKMNVTRSDNPYHVPVFTGVPKP